MAPKERYRQLLDCFELPEILELNDIEQETVLELLIDEGLLDEDDLDDMLHGDDPDSLYEED
jgi:hypothetical protein